MPGSMENPRRNWNGYVRVILLACVASGPHAQTAMGEEKVFGVQLHLHGSMSEGSGSMAGHNHEAQQLNGVVDVLWWTDHDWRIAAHTYVSTFDFEDSLTATEFAPFPAGRVRPIMGRRSGQKRGLVTEGEDLPDGPPGMSAFVKGWVQEEQLRSLTDLEVRFVDDQFRTGKKSLKLHL